MQADLSDNELDKDRTEAVRHNTDKCFLTLRWVLNNCAGAEAGRFNVGRYFSELGRGRRRCRGRKAMQTQAKFEFERENIPRAIQSLSETSRFHFDVCLRRIFEFALGRVYWTLALRRFNKVPLCTMQRPRVLLDVCTEAIRQDCTRRVCWTLALRRFVRIALRRLLLDVSTEAIRQDCTRRIALSTESSFYWTIALRRICEFALRRLLLDVSTEAIRQVALVSTEAIHQDCTEAIVIGR
eukprot:scaffold2736_cov82-Skeletonema_dohrnii-CCMP3373.AAC.13